MSEEPLLIAGIAMVTSVGRSFPDACASIRAGLSRAAPLSHFSVLDEAVQENVPLVGHPLHGISEGFFGPGLWVRLGRLCFAELLSRSIIMPGTDAGFWSRTAILALTPALNGERFSSDEPFGRGYARHQLIDVLVRQMSLPLPDDALFTMDAGSATLFRALAQVHKPLRSGRFDRVIVLCIDSLLDDITLQWLDDHGRLKGPDTPSGVAPGEAAVALMIQRSGVCGPSDRRTHVTLAGIGFDVGPRPQTAAPGAQGVRLACAIRTALAQAGVREPFDGIVVGDLNGEVWKAMEVARARMELIGELEDGSAWVLPCGSVGDVGCAMAGISVAVGSWNVLRAAAPAQPVLAFGLDVDGEVGAVCVAAAA